MPTDPQMRAFFASSHTRQQSRTQLPPANSFFNVNLTLSSSVVTKT
ncbi:MAG TPA: hypothetical protein VES20_14285 [Bryobacteraceae bacterium]|nr:hypothetical protein [Bryobacteraceae bacterium]